MRKGKYSSPTDLQSANSILHSHFDDDGSNNSTAAVIPITEGEEPSEFWTLLLRGDKNNILATNTSSGREMERQMVGYLSNVIRDSTMVKPWRLYQFSCGTGAVDVS